MKKKLTWYDVLFKNCKSSFVEKDFVAVLTFPSNMCINYGISYPTGAVWPQLIAVQPFFDKQLC